MPPRKPPEPRVPSARRSKAPVVGDVVEVPLDGERGYARVLRDPLMAFYALRSAAPLACEDVVKAPVAFTVWVMGSALKSGRWRVVGNVPLTPDEDVAPWFFKQDAISGKLSLYRAGTARPATREECEGLERAAVWSAEHVESRLRDHLARRPNAWVESLRLKG